MADDYLLTDRAKVPIFTVRICPNAHEILMNSASEFQYKLYAELTSLRFKHDGSVGIWRPCLTKNLIRRFEVDKRKGTKAVKPPSPTSIEWAIKKLQSFGLVEISSDAAKELKGRIRLFLPLELEYDQVLLKKLKIKSLYENWRNEE